MTAVHTRLKVALYEGPGSEPLQPGVRLNAIKRLLDAGYGVIRATCLCELTAAEGQALLVLGRFTPQAKASLGAAGDSDSFALRDVEGLDGEQMAAIATEVSEKLAVPPPSGWIPWFPVIDTELCNDCRKCLSFCLFGVFNVDPQGRVRVNQPAKCKTNCPACARVCPQGALVFPKYKSGPIAGDDAPGGDEVVQLDLAQLSKTDIYAALRSRGKKPPAGQELAEQERCECLTRLQQQLDIPQEVLDSLQSPGPAARKGSTDAAR